MADIAVLGGASPSPSVGAPLSRAAPVLTWAGVSDAGRSRGHNEDSWCVLADCGLVLLADGMGGYNAGEVASALAVEAAANHVAAEPAADSSRADAWPDPRSDLLRAAPDDAADAWRVRETLAQLSGAFGAANAAILAAAARRPECLGMGTTLVAARFLGTRHLCYGHVGDSRLYLLRGGRLRRITRDHSVGQAMIDAGVLDAGSARGAGLRGVLTRALGVEPAVDADLGVLELEAGDRVLLCSDGLSDCVPDEAIERLFGVDANVGVLAQSLVDAALEAGGHDNVTVVVVDVDRPSARAC